MFAQTYSSLYKPVVSVLFAYCCGDEVTTVPFIGDVRLFVIIMVQEVTFDSTV
jgi:hypothetical protein